MIILIFLIALYMITTFMYYYSKSTNWLFKNFLLVAMGSVVVVSGVLINDFKGLQELLNSLWTTTYHKAKGA